MSDFHLKVVVGSFASGTGKRTSLDKSPHLAFNGTVSVRGVKLYGQGLATLLQPVSSLRSVFFEDD